MAVIHRPRVVTQPIIIIIIKILLIIIIIIIIIIKIRAKGYCFGLGRAIRSEHQSNVV